MILENTPEKPLPTLTPSTLMFGIECAGELAESDTSLSAIPATGWPTSEPAIFAEQFKRARELVRTLPDAVDDRRERVAVHGDASRRALLKYDLSCCRPDSPDCSWQGSCFTPAVSLSDPPSPSLPSVSNTPVILSALPPTPANTASAPAKLADLSDDVLDGDAAVLQSVREPFDQAYRLVDVGGELAVELVEERGELAAQRVDGGDGGVERLAQRFERELAGAFARRPSAAFHVGERALEGVAGG